MDLTTALSQLRNICINTGNQHMYDCLKNHLDRSAVSNETDQVNKIAELIEYVKDKSSYTGMEASNIMKGFGADSFRIIENSPTQIVFTCKIRRKVFNVKILHPTSRYVLGQGPWKVTPAVYTDSAQKEAKKLQDKLSADHPYKKIEIDEKRLLELFATV